jgi:hypothetical protein
MWGVGGSMKIDKMYFLLLMISSHVETIANRYLEEGVRDGNWVFFANCHLMISWTHQLEKLVENLHMKVFFTYFLMRTKWDLISAPVSHISR